MEKHNLLHLLKVVLSKTLERKTVWHKTSREEQYKLEFNVGFVTIEKGTVKNITSFEAILYNEDGEIIDRLLTTNFLEQEDYEVIKNLHEEARKVYYKADETYEDIFYQLKNDKIIGSDVQTKYVKGSDELPF